MSYEFQQVKELRQRVAKLERTIAFLLEKLNLEYVDKPVGEFPDVSALAFQGKTIEAIKLYREKTGVDLATAKHYVETLGA